MGGGNPICYAYTVNIKYRDKILILTIGGAAGLLILPVVKLVWPGMFLLGATVLFFVVLIGAFGGFSVAFYLDKRFQGIYRFAKFAATGFLNTFLDLDVLNCLIAVTGLSNGWWFSLFKSISFLAALVSSYFWNRYWTFDRRGPMVAGEALKFCVISLLGLLANVFLASLVVNFVPHGAMVDAKLWADLGALIGICGNMAVNFIGYKYWVFKTLE